MPVIKVKVTKKHIKMGKCGSLQKCPVALALLSAKFKDPTVCSDLGVIYKDREYMLATPKKVLHFIDKFDDTKAGKPFEFTLRFKEGKD